MAVVAFGILYFLYYVAISLVCAGATLGVLRLAWRHEGVDESPRRLLAAFLLGTGFAPFLIGLLHLTLLIIFAGLHPAFLAALHCLLAALGLWALRAQLGAACKNALALFREAGSAKWAATAVLCLLFGFMGATVVQTAARPIWHGDTLVYGVEAKALTAGRSYTARLPPIPHPNAKNYIRGNDHPLTYIGLLASGLAFAPDITQDFSLRLALQLQNLTLLTTLAGLGLEFGGFAAVLAPIFVLFAAYFGNLIDMGAREVYRILPVLVIFGLPPLRGTKLALFSPRALLLFAAFLFLWNSHSSSLMLAPLVYGCLFLTMSGWKSKIVLSFWVFVAFLLGANHFIDAYFARGYPLGYEFMEYALQLISQPHTWAPPNPPPSGLSAVFVRLANQARIDGPAVGVLAVGLIGAATLAAKRRHLPVPVAATAVYLFILALQILGFFDWVYPAFGSSYFTVHRLRFSLYPPAAFLAAYVLSVLGNRLPRARWNAVMSCVLVTCLGGSLAVAVLLWEKPLVAAQVVRRDDVLSLLTVRQSCWWDVEQALRREEGGRPPVILTDIPYVPWYYTDHDVIYLWDERLIPARTTKDPAFAKAELDRLGVDWLVFDKADMISGSALDAVVHSPSVSQVVDCPTARGYRVAPGTLTP